MAKRYPREFRDDVVRAARQRQGPLTQVARDFGISDATLYEWMKRADVEDGVRPGQTEAEAAELRELKRRNRVLEQRSRDPATSHGLLRQGRRPKMTYPLVRELADDGIPVTVTCRVLRFSTQGYYKWRRSPCCDRDYENAHLTNAALDAHADDPPFGYRFIADELERQGHKVSERRVWRLCSEQRIWSSFVKKSKSGKKPGPPVHDDLVRRDFTATRMNELWFTDITEHRTDEGKLYVCSIEDAFSGRIVGYSIGSRMTSSLAVSSLRNAITLRNPEGTTCHSDRGTPISLHGLRPRAQEQRAQRFDGASRLRRRQRGDGVVPLAAPEQRLGHQALGDEGGASRMRSSVDRAHLSPPSTQAQSRQDDARRVRGSVRSA